MSVAPVLYDQYNRKLNLTGLKRKSIQARYDAAQTTAENAKYWMMATTWSADQEINPQVRSILRSRARYELGNNPNASGVLDTLAIDVIGTGPRLQINTGDETLNDRIEQAWNEWCEAVRLAENLRLMRYCRAGDGESFLQKITNPQIDHEVKLDIRVIECDQVCSPFGTFDIDPRREIDGILLDKWGNPAYYRVLKYHPGDQRGITGIKESDYDLIPARSFIHYFRRYRPGQHRGIPEMTSALPLFAQLRRYTKATVLAAEAAADAAGVMYTDLPVTGEAVDGIDNAMDTFDLEPGSSLTLPDGWKWTQVDAKQPTATFVEFKRELTGDAGRGQGVTVGKTLGNHSGYNYASGRLDNQAYDKLVKVDQHNTGITVVNPVFRDWLREWSVIERVRMNGVPPHTWFWDGVEPVDLFKDAAAQEKRLQNKTTNLAIEWGKQGRDWRKELRQRLEEEAFEMKERKRLGLIQNTQSNTGDK